MAAMSAVLLMTQTVTLSYQPVEQKSVLLYGDEITAVITSGRVYIPLWSICNNLDVT